jgi:uncharacterized protein
VVHVGSLRQGENRFSFELEPEDLGFSDREVKENPSFEQLLGPVVIEAVVVRAGERLMVSGSVTFRAWLDCALCGIRYQCSLKEPLAAEFMDCEHAATQATDQEETDRAQVDTLDLTALVRDAVHLAVPMAPLCRPDCRGLCPCCGANLNTTGHDSSCTARHAS